MCHGFTGVSLVSSVGMVQCVVALTHTRWRGQACADSYWRIPIQWPNTMLGQQGTEASDLRIMKNHVQCLSL